MSAHPSHSLRARLLWLLLGSVVLVASAQFFIAYRTALTAADEIFDYHMQQMALSLRTGLPFLQPGFDGNTPFDDANTDFVVQIWTLEGDRVFESAESAGLPQLAVIGFSDIKARNSTYRVLSIKTPKQIIQVAQDMAVRRDMAGRLAFRTAAPIVFLVPLMMLLVWAVVKQSLLPVARIRRQVAKRQANDLSPVSVAGLPDEIQPLVKELNLLFERVQMAFDAQQHFVADAAHELRSPLAALRLQVQGLQKANSDEARTTAIVRLTSGIDRATRMVEQLLTLARQEASLSVGVEPLHVELVGICRLALEDTLPVSQERSIDLGLGHADKASIKGHPEALRILVHNLLDNAVKYTPQGGRVDLELRAHDDVVELTVEDSGPGIAAEQRERVMGRFYRVNGSEVSGSGLGLAIAKSIANHHSATLTLGVSANLGGLFVSVRFPASSDS